MFETILQLLACAGRTAHALRAAIGGAMIGHLLYSQVPQIQEIYLVLLLAPRGEIVHIILAGLTLVLACLLTWAVARDALHERLQELEASAVRSIEVPVLKTLPYVLGLLPVAGLVEGLWSVVSLDAHGRLAELHRLLQKVASKGTSPEGGGEIIRDAIASFGPYAGLHQTLLYGASVASAVLVIIIVAGMFAARRFPFQRLRPVRLALLLTTFALIALFALVPIGAGNGAMAAAVSVPRTLGTLTIVNLFLLCLTANLASMSEVYAKRGAPLISVLLVIAVGVSWFNLNDNHQVRLVPRAAAMPKPAEGAERLSSGGIPSIQRALAAWYEARPEKYRRSFTRPYPIFIVAAQGGGTYAANLSAIALAKLYDRCPALKHHVFAISGVSGGSIGAGLLALLIEAEGKTEAPADGSLKCELELKSDTVGPLEERVRKLLGDDFVSPVAGTALFPELLQRFLPGSIPVIDRARAAEAALEASWRREVHSAPDAASQGFLSHWSPKSNSPMLVLNTTSVDSGRRVAIAPVNIPSSEMLKTGSVNVRSIYTHELPETLGDLPMSTALFMSARFPLVLPAAALKGQYFDAYPRYVDGGYADNSGVETAIGIMNALRSSQQKVGAPYDLSSGLKLEVEHRFSGPSPDRTPLELKLIVIGETDTSMKTDLVKEGVAELLSPVRAMYRSRIQRAEIAVERAKREFSADVIAVDREYTNLALALHTAPPTQALIAAQIARPGYCQSSKTHYDIIDAMQDRSDEGNDPQGDGFNMPDMGFVFENACSLCRIIRTVTGAGELPDTNGQCGN